MQTDAFLRVENLMVKLDYVFYKIYPPKKICHFSFAAVYAKKRIYNELCKENNRRLYVGLIHGCVSYHYLRPIRGLISSNCVIVFQLS